jgi:hypothetical protein
MIALRVLLLIVTLRKGEQSGGQKADVRVKYEEQRGRMMNPFAAGCCGFINVLQRMVAQHQAAV